jgi:hypothetical protein
MRNITYILLLSSILILPVKGQEPAVIQYPERIFLHTDRDIYLAGEELFYSMYIKGSGGQLSRYAYILLRDQKNRVVNLIKLEIRDQGSYGAFSLPDTLATGLYQVLCYTNLMRNYEESIFSKEIIIANRFDERMIIGPGGSPGKDNPDYDQGNLPGENVKTILITPDKSVYKCGEKIAFTIDAPHVPYSSISRLSISVSEVFSGFREGLTITDWFAPVKHLLTGIYENGGNCEFDTESDRSVLQGRFFPSQSKGGQKVTSDSGVRSRKSVFTVLISAVDTAANLQFAKTDSLGRFSISLDPYYEDKEVIVRIKENTGGVIELDNKSHLRQPFMPLADYDLQARRDFLMRMSKLGMIDRFYNIIIRTDTLQFEPEMTFLPAVYSRRYSEIIPSDYVELIDFLEITREILPSFKLRKNDGKYISSYTNLQYSSGSSDEPAIFLDGVLIDNVGPIVNLPASEIKSMITVPVQRVYGDMLFNGILCINSFDRVINDFKFATPTIRYRSPVTQLFIKPQPFNPGLSEDHLPDFRQVLLWEPDFKPGKAASNVVECFASDLKGVYRISIQGVTLNGDPLSGSELITITGK